MRIFQSSLAVILLCSSVMAQPSSDDAGSLVRQAMTKNVLTTPGAPPFHAVLDVLPDPKGPDTQRARVELFWAAPEHYALDIASADFNQHLVVDGDRVSEIDHGDYYPAWLHYFVLALFNPLDRADEILAHSNSFHDQPMFADTCYEWDGRSNNLTDAESDAKICFAKSRPQQIFTLDYMRYLSLSDFKSFHDKSIARQYFADLRVTSMPRATLSVLEDWKPDPSKLDVTAPTTTARITFHTQTASEATASIVSKPEHVSWPTTREGVLSGKVLVHVVTDRSGKVREAGSPESDNEELKPFAAELAKQYVFRPLAVNGEAVQVEMPLIISFQLGEQKPYRKFNDAETRARVKGCTLPKEISDPAAAGQIISVEMLIGDNGHISEIRSSGGKISTLVLFRQFQSCHFDPYLEDGKPTVFRVAFDLLAK